MKLKSVNLSIKNGQFIDPFPRYEHYIASNTSITWPFLSINIFLFYQFFGEIYWIVLSTWLEWLKEKKLLSLTEWYLSHRPFIEFIEVNSEKQYLYQYFPYQYTQLDNFEKIYRPNNTSHLLVSAGVCEYVLSILRRCLCVIEIDFKFFFQSNQTNQKMSEIGPN